MFEGFNSRVNNPGLQGDYLMDLTFEDIMEACNKGLFLIQCKENGDGTKQILLCPRNDATSIYYRLHVDDNGNVFFDEQLYRMAFKDKQKIKFLIRDLEHLIKEWLKNK